MSVSVAVFRDHPRTCGEHTPPHARGCRPWGSSPHMRGTRPESFQYCFSGRIIPAHAGNTSGSARCGSSRTDHPRTCGEHHFPVGIPAHGLGSSPHMRGTHHEAGEHALRRAGSSPHMRGTHRRRLYGSLQTGIIPAHAGNTFPRRSVRPVPRDHPRTCGEHGRQKYIDNLSRGSSPHMRGTRSLWGVSRLPLGIIPAHAGNTARSAGR